MSILVGLHHVTRYTYDRAIALGPQVVRLRPAPHCRTRILAYSLSVLPAKHFINWQQDPESNYLARLTFPDKTRELRIEVSASEREVSVEVSDSGPGLPAEIAANLFEPFVTNKAEGMGIGLSVSRQIAERHGGTLVATARAPQGTCFTLVLPLHAADDAG